MLRPKLGLIAALMSAIPFIIAGCGGGQDGGGTGTTGTTGITDTTDTTGITDTTGTTKPADGQAPAQGLGGIGPPPHVFVGTASIDGSPAPDGTLVTAFIEGKTGPVAQGEVSGGTYMLMVEQPSGGDYGGKDVTFKLGELDTPGKLAWEFGGADEVNLSASAGGGTDGVGTPDLVSQGKEIFTGIGGCAACHTIEGTSAGLVGPDLTHIGAQGSERKPGFSAKEYITESIKDPEAFVATGVEGANPGIMTKGITSGFSDGVIDALVAFLLAQK